MRTTKVMTLSLPPEMVKEIDQLVKEEHRTRSELIREALRKEIVEILETENKVLKEKIREIETINE